MAVGAITANSAAVQSLDASKLTAGFIDAQRIRTSTITADMIVSCSCTAFDYYVRNAPSGTQSFSFFMDQPGFAAAVGIVNFTMSGTNQQASATIDFDGFFGSDVFVNNTGFAIPSFSLMTGAALSAGFHNVNFNGFTSNASGDHTFYLQILRSYR